MALQMKKAAAARITRTNNTTVCFLNVKGFVYDTMDYRLKEAYITPLHICTFAALLFLICNPFHCGQHLLVALYIIKVIRLSIDYIGHKGSLINPARPVRAITNG